MLNVQQSGASFKFIYYWTSSLSSSSSSLMRALRFSFSFICLLALYSLSSSSFCSTCWFFIIIITVNARLLLTTNIKSTRPRRERMSPKSSALSLFVRLLIRARARPNRFRNNQMHARVLVRNREQLNWMRARVRSFDKMKWNTHDGAPEKKLSVSSSHVCVFINCLAGIDHEVYAMTSALRDAHTLTQRNRQL